MGCLVGNQTGVVKKINLITLIFAFAAAAVYFYSSQGLTIFNHFARLSDAFLHGEFFVSANAPWLEQVPIDASHFYVPYPPMPAILLMPFRLIFKNLFAQDYLSYLLGAGTVAITILISQVIKKDGKLAVFTGLLTGFGTVSWFLTSVASSWYLGQVSAVFFLTLAIYESLTKKRYLFIGICMGAAYLSRIETILGFPFFLYLAYKNDWLKNFVKILSGILPFLLFNFYYNFARFGVVWDKAYELIPGVKTEEWFSKGVLSPDYIPGHLKIIFTSLPFFQNKFPYFAPGYGGLAIWFTTPVFLYSLFANFKENAVKFSWLSIILIALIVFSHGSTGFAQFGYRFAANFYPFLIFLTLKGIERTGLKWHHWTLLTISVLVNLWGVVLINKLGFANF